MVAMNEQPAPNAEDAALLAAGAALDNDATPPPVGEDGQPIQPIDFNAEAEMFIETVCSTAEAFLTDWAVTIGEATRKKLAAAWAPVFEKYDLTGAGIFGEYRAEIGAAMVTIPVVLTIRKVAKGPKVAKAAADPTAPATPSAGNVFDLSQPAGL